MNVKAFAIGVYTTFCRMTKGINKKRSFSSALVESHTLITLKEYLKSCIRLLHK